MHFFYSGARHFQKASILIVIAHQVFLVSESAFCSCGVRRWGNFVPEFGYLTISVGNYLVT